MRVHTWQNVKSNVAPPIVSILYEPVTMSSAAVWKSPDERWFQPPYHPRSLSERSFRSSSAGNIETGRSNLSLAVDEWTDLCVAVVHRKMLEWSSGPEKVDLKSPETLDSGLVLRSTYTLRKVR